MRLAITGSTAAVLFMDPLWMDRMMPRGAKG
jgi:hypothetical protein